MSLTKHRALISGLQAFIANTSFSAVINPPQGFILAVGKITKVPVVDDCDQIIVGHRVSLTMSCDHRVIDGALGADYLKELRHLLENPALLLV
jgi:pyruvate dehydrogenase E2 component (dihydrolipoamide acetyltransferase)